MISSPRGVHLVGSVPLASNAEVFQVASEILGSHLKRIPDGETGKRTNWIAWQLGVFTETPGFEVVPPPPDKVPQRPTVRLNSEVDPADLVFGGIAYAEAAVASYAEYARLRESGMIPEHCRFQVSLPTPLAPVAIFVEPEDCAAVEGAYERRLLEELDQIVAAVPTSELALQWDVAVEFAMLEGVRPSWLSSVEEGILKRLLRLGERVPGEVELGYHLCYGDAGHKHFKEPEDMTRLVSIANGICAELGRQLNWVHMPVPITRKDAGYFAPLSELRLKAETELYLGLVHFTDGVEGARERIRAAQEFSPPFGVSTECGFGRRPAETIPELMRLHAAVAEPIP